MARCATAPLAKLLQLFKRQIEPRDVKQSIEQSAPMAGRQNESVAVRPAWIARVELQRSVPERVGHGCRPHGQPRMAGVGLLHHVDREKAERVDAQFIQCGRSSNCCDCCRSWHGAFYLSLLKRAEFQACTLDSQLSQVQANLHLESYIAAFRVLARARIP